MKPRKNYLILTAILLFTILLVFYALEWNRVYKEEMANKAYISNYLNELMIDEYDNYIHDNRNTVIYFGITNDKDCRSFEKQFKSVITNYQLSESIVYMSVNAWQGEDLVTTLNNKYSNAQLKTQHKQFKGVPALGIYVDAKLVDLLSGNDLTKESATLLLEEYDIIDNNHD